MRLRLAPTVSIAAAIALALVIAQPTRNAIGQSIATLNPTSWPPIPADMVSMTGTFSFTTNGQMLDVFTVPNQRWLVLTEIRGQFDTGSGMPLPCGVELVELNGSTTTLRLGSAFTAANYNGGATVPAAQGAWSPGIAFPPGSKLQLRVNAPNCVTGSGLVVGNYFYTYAGYYSR